MTVRLCHVACTRHYDCVPGTPFYPTYPSAIGERYVGAYTQLPGTSAFVLVDKRGVCGYVLSAHDSKAFYKTFVEEWLPGVAAKYPQPQGTAVNSIEYDEDGVAGRGQDVVEPGARDH